MRLLILTNFISLSIPIFDKVDLNWFLKYLFKKHVFPTVESPTKIKLKEPSVFINPTFFSTVSDTIFEASSFFGSFIAAFILFKSSGIFVPFFIDISILSR